MVHAISGGHGAGDPHHAHQALSPYIPAIAQHGSQPDTFEHGHGGGHGSHGGHGGHHGGGLLQRMGDKLSTIFWDAVTMPKVLAVKLWETFTGQHASHDDHGHEELHHPTSGFLSGNLADQSMPLPSTHNEFLAKEGFLSGDLSDNSGLYNRNYIVPL